MSRMKKTSTKKNRKNQGLRPKKYNRWEDRDLPLDEKIKMVEKLTGMKVILT